MKRILALFILINIFISPAVFAADEFRRAGRPADRMGIGAAVEPV